MTSINEGIFFAVPGTKVLSRTWAATRSCQPPYCHPIHGLGTARIYTCDSIYAPIKSCAW